MAKSILAIITILALSTSGALAAERIHHRHASPALLSSKGSGTLNAYAAGPANPISEVAALLIDSYRTRFAQR